MITSFEITVGLIALVVGGAYALTKVVPALILAGSEKREKTRKQKQIELEQTPEYQQELIRKRNMVNAIDKTKKLDFVNTKNSNDLFNMRLREEFQFDIDKDVVVKGILRCSNRDKTKVEMPIYLYQPRLFASSNGHELCIGPRKTSDGALDNKYIYLAKKPNGSSIYYGYVPKAEISSGSEFDFVNNNPFNSNSRLLEFINITLEKDSNGRAKVVNLKDPIERQNLLNYIEKYKNTNIFYNYLQIAKDHLEEKEKEERMERIREEARSQNMQERYERSQKTEEVKEEKVDKEREAYRQYYEDQYGYLGAKSSYNKMREVMEDAHENGIPMPPPPRGPRR